jgi:carboxynorspermidine decarboxylase
MEVAMSDVGFKSRIPTSPAFVLDEGRVLQNIRSLQALRQASGCKILYSIKALPLAAVLDLLKTEVDGFSVSSLFEAKLAREVIGEQGRVHLTSPGLRPDEFQQVADHCSHISFNSLSQLQTLQSLASGYSCGLRVNPKLSFVDDQRFDPCRRHSKLGVSIELLANGLPAGVEGLHLHNVFAQRDLTPLLQTLQMVRPLLEGNPHLRWLNLGGGYLYADIADHTALANTLTRLRGEFGLDIYLEPGKAVVGNAGYLLSTVLDRFDSDGKTVLILDTSVNHHPEVFEYQRQPLLLENVADGAKSAILAGSSCLAGDLFGEYRFNCLPDVGDRLVFADVGAYSLIKANRFNGYNFPDVYSVQGDTIRLRNSFDYGDYRRQWQV